MAESAAIAHRTVFAEEAVAALLAVPPAGDAPVYVDATFGGGGHSRLILQNMPKDARLLALDCDARAAEFAAAQGQAQGGGFVFARRNYSELEEVLDEHGLHNVRGVLFDLGVSSMQLDEAARGFSFQADAPLDMRMDSRAEVSAAEWLQQASEEEIRTVLRQFGEEPEARRIAAALAAQREGIRTTGALALAVAAAKRRPSPPGRHPATRTFQAIRMAVNDELAHLQKGLAAARRALQVGGRLVVIAFHSLEDRMVKRLAAVTALPGIGRVGSGDLQPVGRMRRPSAEEVAANPRARSACLRVFAKTDGTAEGAA